MDDCTLQINRYLHAGFPILYIETFEENRICHMLSELAAHMKYTVVEYNSRGVYRDDIARKANCDLAHVLRTYIAPLLPNKDDFFDLQHKLLILKDSVKYLDNPAVSGALKYIADSIMSGQLEARIAIVASVVDIPKELEHLITLVTLKYPLNIEIANIINEFCKENSIALSDSLKDKLTNAMKGMPAFDIRNTLSLAYLSNGKLTEKSLDVIHEQKKQYLKKSGIMDMIDVPDGLYDQVGGLRSVKHYLERKKEIFQNLERAEAFGIDHPKGILIAGLPGCGKSLTAKAAATLFQVPLIRLDMGRMMGKYVGESEANLRHAIQIADAIAPCILWVDELEKAFSGVGGQGTNAELTTRLMGNFLTWMQEKTSLAFVIATVNNISEIPAELLRKGRFDELFYVDLPNDEEREAILNIHIIKRRPTDLKHINVKSIASDMEGYSGADIEGVVKDALEECFHQGLDRLYEEALRDAMNLAHPLNQTMEDEIEEMRKGYEKRQFKNASGE